MDTTNVIERLYQKLDEIEVKLNEIRLALIPEEDATEEEIEIIRRGREEIERGNYIKLEDALKLIDE